MRLKQRIVRILIEEIVADVDEERREIVLLIHWAGGRHSELRMKKKGIGEHRRCTSATAVDVVRQMAGTFSDEQIALTLNRLGLRTGAGNTWNELRVSSLRSYRRFPAHDPSNANHGNLTLERAAGRLGVSPSSVRRLIESKTLPATQVAPYAPGQIAAETIGSAAVLQAVNKIKNRMRVPQTQYAEPHQPLFS